MLTFFFFFLFAFLCFVFEIGFHYAFRLALIHFVAQANSASQVLLQVCTTTPSHANIFDGFCQESASSCCLRRRQRVECGSCEGGGAGGVPM